MSTTNNSKENYGNEDLIKPYTTKQLAVLYDVSPRVMRTWVKPFKEVIGKRSSTYYTIKQVEIIFDKLGLPRA